MEILSKITPYVESAKNNATQAIGWMGNHKVETVGYATAALLGVGAVAAAAAGVLTFSPTLLIVGGSLLLGSLALSSGISYVHVKQAEKEDVLDSLSGHLKKQIDLQKQEASFRKNLDALDQPLQKANRDTFYNRLSAYTAAGGIGILGFLASIA